jgi:hypothetical protein
VFQTHALLQPLAASRRAMSLFDGFFFHYFVARAASMPMAHRYNIIGAILTAVRSKFPSPYAR